MAVLLGVADGGAPDVGAGKPSPSAPWVSAREWDWYEHSNYYHYRFIFAANFLHTEDSPTSCNYDRRYHFCCCSFEFRRIHIARNATNETSCDNGLPWSYNQISRNGSSSISLPEQLYS